MGLWGGRIGDYPSERLSGPFVLSPATLAPETLASACLMPAALGPEGALSVRAREDAAQPAPKVEDSKQSGHGSAGGDEERRVDDPPRPP